MSMFDGRVRDAKVTLVEGIVWLLHRHPGPHFFVLTYKFFEN